MSTSKAKRERERVRKAERKAAMIPLMQQMKQILYFQQTGYWESNPQKLDWHHRDPTQKTRKISKMYDRSPQTIAEELAKCVLFHQSHHRALHRGRRKS